MQRQNELDATYDEEHGIPPKYYFTYRIRVTNVGSVDNALHGCGCMHDCALMRWCAAAPCDSHCLP